MCFVLILVFTLSLVSEVLPFSFTTHTEFQVQSSFLLDVVVRLYPVIVNSNCVPNSCIFHIAKTGFLKCCPYRLRRTNGVIQVDENPSAWRSGKWIPHQCFKPDRKHEHLHFGPDSLLSQRGRKHQIPRVQISRTGVAMVGWQWSHRIIRNSMGSGAQCIIVQRRAFFY